MIVWQRTAPSGQEVDDITVKLLIAQDKAVPESPAGRELLEAVVCSKDESSELSTITVINQA